MPLACKNAVISVCDKTDLAPFLQELAQDDWQLFATEGTRKSYKESNGKEINALTHLVTIEGLEPGNDREMTAQLISGLVICRKVVQLACINLRPPRLEGERPSISLDVGGMAMISAASNSGALVVTQPRSYEQVLSQIRSPNGVDPAFQQQLQMDANAHIMGHLASANSLIN